MTVGCGIYHKYKNICICTMQLNFSHNNPPQKKQWLQIKLFKNQYCRLILFAETLKWVTHQQSRMSVYKSNNSDTYILQY
jgi:hypothetical protein